MLEYAMKKIFILLITLNVMLLNANNSSKITPHSAGYIPKNMTVNEKKDRFRVLLIPAIDKVYSDLDKLYYEVKLLLKKDKNSQKIKELMLSYSAKNHEDLLQRIKPHAKSVALAQAAIESAWGTSRFFRVANNVFGVWSYNKNEPRVAANGKRGKRTIYIKKYNNISSSVKDYYKILASAKVYEKFREEKMRSNNPYKLTKQLDKYSEIGAEYGRRLSSMIKFNKFDKLD